MTSIANTDLRRKARKLSGKSHQIVAKWLRGGVTDFKRHFKTSMLYGLGLFLLGWTVVLVLGSMGLGWAILPMIAGGMLLGPLATIGLYHISRRSQWEAKGYTEAYDASNAAPSGQVFLVSVVMMVLLLAWIRAATLLFAVFYGLHPFAGFLETTLGLLDTPMGILFLFVGTAVGGLFAALGFAISAFAFPLLVDRNIDGFSAMGLSFNATTQNFSLTIVWAVVVTVLIVLSVLTGLLALIPIFPILGFATWHAYSDLFQE